MTEIDLLIKEIVDTAPAWVIVVSGVIASVAGFLIAAYAWRMFGDD